MGRRKINEIGNRYGRLIVLEEAGYDGWGHVTWKCLCDCGNETIVVGAHLRGNNTQSCGCLLKEVSAAKGKAMGGSNKLPLGCANFNALYCFYKGAAKKRGLSFKLTKEDFSFLTKMNCFYCGSEPAQVNNLKRCNGGYIYNGIDRTDSSKGYTMNNVVPCCGKCNRMKWNMTVSEFKQQMFKIIRYKNWEVGDENHTSI